MVKLVLLFLLFFDGVVYATSPQTPVRILANQEERAVALPEAVIRAEVERHFVLSNYREVRVQSVRAFSGDSEHLLVHLVSRGTHRMRFARVLTDRNYRFLQVTENYELQESDLQAQRARSTEELKCPDDSTEFISFVPNDNPEEQGYAREVTQAARAHGLVVAQLFGAAATRAAYLNYLVCPKLRGNFYDGDADSKSFETYDGLLTYSDFQTLLKNQFNYAVTHIWVACEAFNDPLLSTLIKGSQAKKYAAGKNDLDVGPSDKAAICGMKAALDGLPMTQSFWNCVKQNDDNRDIWGFGGAGSDSF